MINEFDFNIFLIYLNYYKLHIKSNGNYIFCINLISNLEFKLLYNND